jgi:hypothetical protein
MDNHSYNLVKALGEVAESLPVYDVYVKDSASCQDCEQLYKTLRDEANRQTEVMKKLLVSHVKADVIK